MSESIFVFTAGDSSARAHLKDSIEDPIPLGLIADVLTDDERTQIENLSISNTLYAWGAVPGSRNIPLWEGMKTNDWVLCVFDSTYHYVAQVKLKIHNREVSERVWGAMPDGTTWEYMYFMSQPVRINVSLDKVSDFLNARYMGFTKIGDDKLNSIVEKFGSVKAFVDETLLVNYELDSSLHPFDSVTREDVIEALAKLDKGEMAGFEPSISYDLIWEGKRYPPKAAIGLATIRTLGRVMRPDEFKGGADSKCFKRLKELQFDVVEKEDSTSMGYFVIRSNEKSEWADQTGSSYHYNNNVANSLPLSAGGYVIVDRRLAGGKHVMIGYGKLEIAEKTIVDGKVDFVSKFSEWVPLIPPRELTEQEKELIASQPKFNSQHSIRKISSTVYNSLLGSIDMPQAQPQHEPYTVEQACEDLFMEQSEFEALLSVFYDKQNLILQGAPGTGKSHIAKRLAYALMGKKSDSQVRMIQFHQAYSYEDFMGGYRPTVINNSAGFDYRPGVFKRFCEIARKNSHEKFVFIIDEINRGNLSKIFGETMLLIESDKRGPAWGIELTYSSGADPLFFIPQNVYLLGLMNTADRSLAMVDYALRRRFAFKTLTPAYGMAKFSKHLESRGVSQKVLKKITDGMEELNLDIEKDRDLGRGFVIGHSFFSSPPPDLTDGGQSWLQRTVESEIRPLLYEYWFDKPEDEIDAKISSLMS